MKLSPDVYFAGSDVKEQNAFDSRPSNYWKRRSRLTR